MPEYGEGNSPLLQDVMLWSSAGFGVARALEAFFRRIRDGPPPGDPRHQGRDRSTSFTYPQVGEPGGARLENGFLVLSKIRRIAGRWSRPWEGGSRPSP